MEKYLEHKLNWQKISEGLGISIELTKEFVNDGRIIGRLGEFIDTYKTQSARQNENSSFDNLTHDNKKREIRSCREKVSFAASKEVGYGRKVTEDGFIQKLNNVDEFGVIDSRKINDGKLIFYRLTKDDVLSLPLGKNKSISSIKFWDIIEKTL